MQSINISSPLNPATTDQVPHLADSFFGSGLGAGMDILSFQCPISWHNFSFDSLNILHRASDFTNSLVANPS
jgi:hypothetical protein